MERELLLLGLLRQHRMHGYELSGVLGGALASCVDLKKPTAYFLLDKMAANGWARVKETREGNRPPRKTYTITTEGETEFQRLLRANLAEFDAPKAASDVAIAFMDALPPSEVITLLQDRRAILLAHLERAQSAPQHSEGLQLLIDHQTYLLQSELSWLDSVITRLRGTRKATVKSHTKQLKEK